MLYAYSRRSSIKLYFPINIIEIPGEEIIHKTEIIDTGVNREKRDTSPRRRSPVHRQRRLDSVGFEVWRRETAGRAEMHQTTSFSLDPNVRFQKTRNIKYGGEEEEEEPQKVVVLFLVFWVLLLPINSIFFTIIFSKFTNIYFILFFPNARQYRIFIFNKNLPFKSSINS